MPYSHSGSIEVGEQDLAQFGRRLMCRGRHEEACTGLVAQKIVLDYDGICAKVLLLRLMLCARMQAYYRYAVNAKAKSIIILVASSRVHTESPKIYGSSDYLRTQMQWKLADTDCL